MREFHFQMVREPHGKRHDGERRVGVAAGRENGAAGNIEIGNPVHASVPVDDACFGIVAHARRAHVMIANVELLPV